MNSELLNQNNREPLGDVLIGSKDPRYLTRTEFLESPEILFHGSERPFAFDESYLNTSNTNRPSQTLGLGFYAQPDRDGAISYSRARQSYAVAMRRGINIANGEYENLEPHLMMLLPYQAKMYDFRYSSDLNEVSLENMGNANVPERLKSDWVNFLQKFVDSEDFKTKKMFTRIIFQEYVKNLPEALTIKDISLRQLLNVDHHRELNFPTSEPVPRWGRQFSDFMLEQGYDGIIYNEPGEGKSFFERKIYPTHVFYNLEKVGDYDTWQARKRD